MHLEFSPSPIEGETVSLIGTYAAYH